ncbi:MAG: hypothetical protein DRH04_03535 [Deltaproteobacteria bacterium]|nr:MAG: hypothetical protein DRH04_03535 [Deltaproteobacteria bacterium]
MEKQRLFDGSLVAVGPHRLDLLVCSDGVERYRCECFLDCRGGAHGSAEELEEANNAIVAEVLDALCAAAGDYTQHDDYSSCYPLEDTFYGGERVEEWIRDHCDVSDDVAKELAKLVEWDYIDAEPEYCWNEYNGYYGKGCCVGGFAVGECEEQIDISTVPEFAALGKDALEAAFAAYNGDAFLHENSRWDKEKECRVPTGYIEHGCFYFYHEPGGRWDFVIPAERMEELVSDAMIQYCRLHDGKGK